MSTFAIKLGTYAIGSTAPVSAIDIITSRRITQTPIIRSNMTVIPEGKMQALKVSLKGTLTGADYTDFRTLLGNLRRALESSKLPLYLDSDRYMNVIHTGLDYAFITKDFCNYSANFLGELPYWLDAGTSYHQTSPTTAVTYPIAIDSDVRIPLRIEITAATATTIADNIQFENSTLGLLCKFRGTVLATQILIIDGGYSNSNIPTYTVTLQGQDVTSSFEGDFMAVASGTNWMCYTGAPVGTVMLYWRKGYYT